MARLGVSDHGVRIAPRIQGRVFDPFFTNSVIGQGMGLGLSICKVIVKAHGGTLAVESEVGKGSTFRVELPAAPAETR
jgi:two-component system, NtrC family, sensor kinase